VTALCSARPAAPTHDTPDGLDPPSRAVEAADLPPMGWWEHLTSGQGTVLGGAFVVIAAIIAFSTGWFQRRIEQKRARYDELKAVYVEVLELSDLFSTIDNWDHVKENRRVMSALDRYYAIGALLALTGEYASAKLAFDYMAQQLSKSLERLGNINKVRQTLEPMGLADFAKHMAGPLNAPLRQVGPITRAETEQRLRRELKKQVPITECRYRRALRRRVPTDKTAAKDETAKNTG
jgi:hypothetical protein